MHVVINNKTIPRDFEITFGFSKNSAVVIG